MSLEDSKGLSREELDTLFREYHPRVFNYIYSQTFDRGLADDVAAETMLNVVRAAHTYDPEKGAVSTWVFRIARNLLFNHWRRQRETVDLEAVPEGTFASEDPENDVLGEREKVVATLMSLLAPPEREAVYLRFWEGMRNVEIAEALGITASAVGTRINRAMEKMRAYASDHNVDLVAFL